MNKYILFELSLNRLFNHVLIKHWKLLDFKHIKIIKIHDDYYLHVMQAFPNFVIWTSYN